MVLTVRVTLVARRREHQWGFGIGSMAVYGLGYSLVR